MITINIYYTGTNGSARKFADEMMSNGIAERIRNESGNIRYEYYFSYEKPETVLLIDSWKDQSAIDAHHASDMMQTITRLREKYDLHMQAERYVSDDTEIPLRDKKFIRE